MRNLFLLFFCAVTLGSLHAQAPSYDNCANAFVLDTVSGWCSRNAQFTTVGATPTVGLAVPRCIPSASTPNDVWFVFDAIGSDLSVSVSGATRINSGGTLRSPQFAIYTGSCGSLTEINACISDAQNRNTVQVLTSRIVVGQRYFVRVSSRTNGNGTFQLCINNFTATQAPNSDCPTGNILCDKKAITVPFVQGEGRDTREVDGFCGRLGCNPSELQSNWFKWTCDNPGTLAFTINPLNPDDDIDFVLFELPNGVNNCGGKRAIRCMSAGENVGNPLSDWIRCTGPTGLRTGENGTVEYCGCEPGYNNFISAVNMVRGQAYALVVNNYSQSGAGYTITFSGTGTFVGPKADFKVDASPSCIGQEVTFTDASTFSGGLNKWEWFFGPTSNQQAVVSGKGEHKVQFNRPGKKNVVLNVTSTDGCLVTQVKEIEVKCCNDHFTLSGQARDENCPNSNTGSIDVGVRNNYGPYTYVWSNGTRTEDLQNLRPGNYSLSITDQATCDTTVNFTIKGPPAFNLSVQTKEATCNGGRDGELSVRLSGGSGPYQYSWNNGPLSSDPFLRNIASGRYSLRWRDQNGCEKDTTLQVRELTLVLDPSVNGITRPTCFGLPNGSIVVRLGNGTGPYQYDWNDGQGFRGDNSLRNIRAGTYRVAVRDQNLCRGEFNFSVEDFPRLALRANKSDPSCFGARDGSVDIVGAGGTGTYTFLWDNGSIAPFRADLPSGTYRVTLSDANGCTRDTSATLVDPPQLSIGNVQPQDLICFGNASGIISLLGQGGRPPYKYGINGGAFQSDNRFIGLRAGRYTVAVEDAGGCTASQDVTLNEPPQLVVDAGLDTIISLGQKITIAATPNNTPVSFQWSPADLVNCSTCQTTVAGPLRTARFKIEVTDGVGCKATDELLITVVKNRPIYIPNGFSPDLDGKNDFFTLYGGPAARKIRRLQIYDRWGEQLFDTKDIPLGQEPLGWNGTYRNQAMPAGVYVYVAEIEFIDDEVLLFKGDVSLIR
jgi:gliding motility-associated-like protein